MPLVDRLPLEALSVPFGDLIASVGRGVADAQREMDFASFALLQEIYRDEGPLRELQRIGYRPNWYHIPEVEGELQVALTISGEETRSASSSAATRGWYTTRRTSLSNSRISMLTSVNVPI